ncbi:VOC family protein [Dyadobacter psychrophilus]|uniref:Catechol 2,3-dioxygenase n=1 Tax=Dyadobacter psychrophilus TaxID=651661 RepID=A0A1T5EPK2_9BACT|nr:VOC family protein [Dyadobacter psychrophilus]SKB85854.1 Catechol 2,3-dioxygenase [Dyadobacter psychrophilus]
MKIIVTSVMVDDQEKARAFYTEKLGFKVKSDVPVGEYKWLTVVSPEDEHSVELLLEPMAFGPAKVYQKQLFDANIPATMFGVDNIQETYEKLMELGVKFKGEPKKMGDVTIAVFEDTCGNLIQIAEQH